MRDFQLPGRSAVYASNAICATSHPLAAKVALDILQAGGTAVDAAVAGAVLLGLCEPQMAGIGGDCFVLLKPAGTERVIGLNGSGRAPMGLTAEGLRAKGYAKMPIHGIDTVTMPGAIDAFCTLHAAHGRLPLAQILAPAIHYAEAGVPVAPRVARDWAEDATVLQGDARKHFLLQGAAPQIGQLFRTPSQAEVLRRVAREGRAGFYEGEVAEDMIASLRALGGVHDLADLAAVKAEWTNPIVAPYQATELYEHPPNSQGATAILMLNILKHFELGKLDPLGAARAHLEAEATKLAYDARNRFIADPTTHLDHLLSPQTAERLAALIDPKRALPDPAPLTEAVHKDTVYITVVDRDRMAVSLIYSVFWGFGSGLASQKFGINFQNRGAGFSLIPGHPNEAAGSKRPMHTIIPAMLAEGGRVNLPFGVMGGSYQPCGHARFVTNLSDYGMDLQTAIDAPRAFCGPEGFKIERGYRPDVLQQLVDLGHPARLSDEALGGAQAIRIRSDGVLEGASDPRKDGCALGY